jgi:hypothetical protein
MPLRTGLGSAINHTLDTFGWKQRLVRKLCVVIPGTNPAVATTTPVSLGTADLFAVHPVQGRTAKIGDCKSLIL